MLKISLELKDVPRVVSCCVNSRRVPGSEILVVGHQFSAVFPVPALGTAVSYPGCAGVVNPTPLGSQLTMSKCLSSSGFGFLEGGLSTIS